ncbi:MAG: hypothetical protein PHQ12_13895 [Chthoniobacteraceae bacterium]|nr:hypothetical protein [Chthoniobacteraceae bacterium]
MTSSRHSSHSHPDSPSAIKIRKRRHYRVQSGRLYIFLLFLWLRIVDAAMLLCVYPKLPVLHQRTLVLFLGITAVWSTGLLIAIWFRQNWAKYILVGSLLFTVVFSLSMIPGLPDAMHPRKEFYFILGVTAIYLPVAIVLIVSKHIHKLTEQEQFD